MRATDVMNAPGHGYETPCLSKMTVRGDLVALGSVIYRIATGSDPYWDDDSCKHVTQLYEDGEFPELSWVPFAEIIGICWRQEAESAKTIVDLAMRHSEEFQSA